MIILSEEEILFHLYVDGLTFIQHRPSSHLTLTSLLFLDLLYYSLLQLSLLLSSLLLLLATSSLIAFLFSVS